MPILAFPTTGGDEREQEGQGMIRTFGPYLDDGRIRIFSNNGVQNDSFQNKGAHPFHRSRRRRSTRTTWPAKSSPFIDSQCQTPGIPITTYGASLSAFHAANTLFKHSRPREALLRALRRLRHARLDGRDLRRQLLFQ